MVICLVGIDATAATELKPRCCRCLAGFASAARAARAEKLLMPICRTAGARLRPRRSIRSTSLLSASSKLVAELATRIRQDAVTPPVRTTTLVARGSQAPSTPRCCNTTLTRPASERRDRVPTPDAVITMPPRRSPRGSDASPQASNGHSPSPTKKTIAKKPKAPVAVKWENGKNLDQWCLPPCPGSYYAEAPLDQWCLPPAPGKRA